MKKRLILVVLFLWSCATEVLLAQSKKLENSLLWEISGKGLSKPSYLFGTIHMICPDDFVIKDKVKNALAKADRLMLEINMADPGEMAYAQKVAMSPVPLSQKLSPKDFARMDSIFTSISGISLKKVDNFTLFTAYSLLLTRSLDCKNVKSYEGELTKLAKERKLPIGGLESVKFQMDLISSIYTEEFLMKQFELFNEYKTMLPGMIAVYKAENINKLYEEINDDKFSNEAISKKMIEDRNRTWARTIPSLIKNESVLFAVGSGHLGGDVGVIELLREEGFTVKPVMD